jgi:hypothetical protein
MLAYAQVTPSFVNGELQNQITDAIKAAPTLLAASQKWADVMFTAFPNTALVRVYATVRFEQLPAFDQAFVKNAVAKSELQGQLTNQTQVLSLLGTRGRRPAWNDRLQSRGHLSIPLLSGQFVESIPMLAQMLAQFGLGTGWIDRDEADITLRVMGQVGAVFYVPDAATFRDSADRLVIPAQDFVQAERVRTVFGLGGTYLGQNRAMCLLLCFTKEKLERSVVEGFLPLISCFKIATMPLVYAGTLFA